MFTAKSLIFYPGYFSDNCQELSDEIIIPSYHVNKLMEEFDEGERLYIKLINTENNMEFLTVIGIPHNYDKNTVFVPQWILNLLECPGNNDTIVRIQKADIDDIPILNKITIRPLDPIAFDIDTLECFQKTLMNLHSIKEKIIIPINLPEIDKDFVIYAYIEAVEPGPIARIIGGEINVEFINDFEEPAPAIEPTQPPIINPYSIPIISPLIKPEENTVVIPEISLDERRQRVRESWLKRFQNNAESQ